MATTTHIGRKIERIREIKGMKQDTLATMLGVSQQAISKMEQSEKIDDEKLEVVAKALGVTAEAIKHFNEEAIIQIIANTFNDNSANYACNTIFNPIEKIVQLYDEKIVLYNEKIALYERMLKEKDAIIERLSGEKTK